VPVALELPEQVRERRRDQAQHQPPQPGDQRARRTPAGGARGRLERQRLERRLARPLAERAEELVRVGQ